MKRSLFVLTLGLSLASLAVPFAQPTLPVPPAQAANDETARINAWFEKKFEEQLAFSPIRQTFLGRKSGAIDEMSIAAQDKVVAWRRWVRVSIFAPSTTRCWAAARCR